MPFDSIYFVFVLYICLFCVCVCVQFLSALAAALHHLFFSARRVQCIAPWHHKYFIMNNYLHLVISI